MASVCRSIKDKKRRRRVDYRPLDQDPYREPIPANAQQALEKLRNTAGYEQQTPRELKKWAVDLTNAEIIRSTWFGTPRHDGGEEEGAEAPQVHRLGTVELFLAQPAQGEHREHTLTGSVAGNDSIERKFERFCSYGVCTEAAVRVDGVYLKWEASSLVIPKLEKIRDETEGPQPLSIGDELPRALGESGNLDNLLELVARYNGGYIYKRLSRNSKSFVRDALHALRKDVPPLLDVFENYQQRIHDACLPVIQKEFGSHRDLDEYYKRTDHAIIVRNKRNVEYLFFVCVCFHVRGVRGRSGNGGRGGRGGTCTEEDCCLPYLLSDLPEDGLMFDRFWQTFTENGGNY